jgi:hypothetical protein
VSAGRLHSLIATSKGVYAFGDNAHGQCGQDPEAQPFVTHNRYGQITPVLIPSDSPVVKVSNSFDRFINLIEIFLSSNEFLIFVEFFTHEVHFFAYFGGKIIPACRTLAWKYALLRGRLGGKPWEVHVYGNIFTIYKYDFRILHLKLFPIGIILKKI